MFLGEVDLVDGSIQIFAQVVNVKVLRFVNNEKFAET